jgi:hypothetical protein
MKQKRKDKYILRVTRREALQVHDEPGHTLMLVEMEGVPIEYEVGVAGEFVSRRSVTFHDRTRGSGPMQGYVMAYFESGAVYSHFEGHRDADNKISTGTWKTYRGTGKLRGIKGEGTFKVTPGGVGNEFIMEMEGEYEAA